MSILQLMATRGAAAAWTPADLSNKVGWWRASDITGKVDGDSVTAWPDSFGLLSDATGTGTYRTGANGIGGVQAIEFDGSSNYFQTGYTGTPTNYFSWAICTLGSTASAYERVIDKNYINGFFIGRFNTSTIKVAAGSYSAINNAVNFTSPIYILFGRSGSSAILEASTNTRTDTTLTTALSTDELVIGATTNLEALARLEGLIAEVGFLSTYPSASDLTNLRSYITTTYGITTS